MTAPTTKPAIGEGAAPSLIHMLHARYEAAMAEYNVIDTAQPRQDENPSEYWRCQHGMMANNEEVDLIRRAILWQIPSNDEDLTLLCEHLWVAHDLTDPMLEEDKKAISAAITTVFDYLVTAGRIDINAHGRQLHNDAMLAFNSRRYRTGQVEEA